jgi:hypothetical protein
VAEGLFFDCVLIEPGDGAQPPGNGGAGAASGLQVACEALDVSTAGKEQPQLVLLAPGRVLAQVQLAGLPGQAAVSGQEPG